MQGMLKVMTGLTNPLQLATVHLLLQNRQSGIGVLAYKADTPP